VGEYDYLVKHSGRDYISQGEEFVQLYANRMRVGKKVQD
jgi:hypothetical protein